MHKGPAVKQTQIFVNDMLMIEQKAVFLSNINAVKTAVA